MIIGGLQKFSLLDYPGKISAIVFTQGCNFKCPFCYNPMLVAQSADEVQNTEALKRVKEKKSYSLGARSSGQLSENDFFVFLRSRLKKLDAVVITGGEPTLHPDIISFAKKIKDLNFKVKLDTNGAKPETLEKLLTQGLVDYIAMDIKTAPEKYNSLTGIDFDFEKIRKSIIMIKEGSVPYEFRTTIVPEMHAPEDIEKIGKIIKGARKWYLQEFKSDIDLIDNSLKKTGSYSLKALRDFKARGSKYVNECILR